MFRDSIRQLVENTEGAVAGLLMDLEGIPVESYSRAGAELDIEVVGAEASMVVKAVQRAGEMLDAGQVREISFQSDRMVTLVRILNANYFLILALDPSGNFGKGRFLLRTTAPMLASELL